MTITLPTAPKVEVFADRAAMGARAAQDVADELRARLAKQDIVRMIFAAAPSQSDALAALASAEGIDWSRVHAFHMDEYIGLPADHEAGFGNWLRSHIFDRLPLGRVELLWPGDDPQAAAKTYAAKLTEAPIDLVLMGVGQNGHIAFNDPPVADFDDPVAVKVVELDDVCRQQQVDDDCFDTFDDVPTHALTVTVPALISGERLFCVVPTEAKRDAVRNMLTAPISEACPATALRTHPDCTVYLDPGSDPGLD
ncbi:6-phosphogluconolactonase [Propionibacteriaceae bacterium Y1700]|uniref:6-phosphogluconolactonase n=1 Tax=Microlunatus sp. Y1700 TaxID=3418487 RepID=UPI003DA711E4